MFAEPRISAALSPTTLALACAVVSVAVLGFADAADAWTQPRGNAQAEQSQGLRERPVRALASPGRYVTEGGEAFILDHSGARPLLRFDDSPEVWVLRATPAPRGDILYRNDQGDVILRSTPSGGLTLYTPRAPGGEPASQAGPGPGLRRPTLSPIQLVNFMVRQSDVASRAVGHLVVFEAEEISPGSETLVAEAAAAAVEALTRMARTSNLRDQAQQVRRIVIIEGARNNTEFSRGVLTITLDPREGPAGRPSSARVVRTLAGS
ncbi:DUF4908 domain-containing protein [Brevundimonas sp. BAL450]|jgi:hypothetical protein|nr:DUF4908 domain-containing protein [Brevundimonas sp. BAL450]MBG7614211.1 DUF4908 domain-containing protein [Brevundimonas sp. BAL450]